MVGGAGLRPGRRQVRLALALGLLACPAPAARATGPDPAGGEPVLAVLFTSEARGNLKPCG